MLPMHLIKTTKLRTKIKNLKQFDSSFITYSVAVTYGWYIFQTKRVRQPQYIESTIKKACARFNVGELSGYVVLQYNTIQCVSTVGEIQSSLYSGLFWNYVWKECDVSLQGEDGR